MNKVIKRAFLKAKKPQNIEQFGYWLAGLIDADGHIDKEGNISIYFHQRDLRVAYYIKKVIGYGSILKQKNSKSYRYRCCRKDKVTIIGDMLRHKLRSPTRLEQFNSRLVPKIGGTNTLNNLGPIGKTNHWLAGFIQGDGSFQVKINNRGISKEQVQVVIQITQKSSLLLKQIKQTFGGYIYYYKPQDYSFYSSSSIPNAMQFVNYLDHFKVISSSFKIYQLWRQACLDTRNKQSRPGPQTISDLKESMTKLKIKPY